MLRIRWTTFAAILFLALVLASPWLLTEQVWDGSFELQVEITAPPAILERPIRGSLAKDVLSAKSQIISAGDRFDNENGSIRRNSPHELQVTVPCAGRRGLFRDTYRFPRFLVLEYYPESDPALFPVRQGFEIPPGRGDRSMTVSLRN